MSNIRLSAARAVEIYTNTGKKIRPYQGNEEKKFTFEIPSYWDMTDPEQLWEVEEPTEKIFLVYQDYDGGQNQHVIAESAVEAKTKVTFQSSRATWLPWLTSYGGRAVDDDGVDYGTVIA